MDNDARNDGLPEAPGNYEPPAIERVMDADELAREVHYAGFTRISELT